MKILRLTVAWLGLVSVVLFLLANVRTTDSGVGYLYLVMSGACAGTLILSTGDIFRRVYVQHSALYLFAFVAWFLLRLLLDVPDLGEVKGVTIGTSGGLVFALILGVLVSIFVSTTYELQGPTARDSIFLAVLLLGCLLITTDVFRSLLAIVREDLFVIDVDRRKYQRPGNFIVITAMILSMQIASIGKPMSTSGSLRRLVNGLNVIVYLIAISVLLATSQLIGSNAGFVITLAISGATVLWLWRPSHSRIAWSRYLLAQDFRSAEVLLRSIPAFFWRGMVLLLILVAMASLLLSVTQFDVQQLRIFGFGEGRLGGNSIASRMRILSNNFLIQFAHSPVFGNMRADDLTTGPGTYAHSLLSIFSHLGIVGALLFVAYVTKVFKDIGAAGTNALSFFGNRDIGLFRIMLLALIVGFALLATFFSWMPMWFSLGALCPPVLLYANDLAPGILRYGARGNTSAHRPSAGHAISD